MPKIPKKKNLQPAKTNFVFKFLKFSTESKFVYYFFLKLIMKRNYQTFFYYICGQQLFLLFLKKKKNTKQILIFNFLFDKCSFM